MSCYFIAQINIHDPKEYQKYLDSVDQVFAKFNGKYLALDCNPEVLEGSCPYNRIALIEFPNENELKRWYESPDYQKILMHRLNAADCSTVMVRGRSD